MMTARTAALELRLTLATTIMALGLVWWAPVPALAEEAKVTTATPAAELTAEEKAEREGRKACKVAMCSAMRAKAAGTDIACDITKSFRKEQLEKIVGKAKVSWPWGKIVCKASVKANRETLIKAMSDDKLEAEFDTHMVACDVERDKDGPASITAEMTPKVRFEKGKAVKASLNWGKVEGPTLIKGAMWTATATDNTVNVLGKMIVDDINDFVTTKCDEVKAEWEGQ